VGWTSCMVVYTVSYGLIRSHTFSHGLVRPLIRPYTDMTLVPGFKSFKSHTRLSQITECNLDQASIGSVVCTVYTGSQLCKSCVLCEMIG